jgi:hypothetical protein
MGWIKSCPTTPKTQNGTRTAEDTMKGVYWVQSTYGFRSEQSKGKVLKADQNRVRDIV